MDTLNGTPTSECDCKECQSYCQHKPGWFAPDEIEPAARLLGMSVQEFFTTYLGVDWWGGNRESNYKDIFVLAPATHICEPGKEYPANPKGRCVFFEEGRCKIHAARPIECKIAHHAVQVVGHGQHLAVAQTWVDHQEEIVALLGREPEKAEYSVFDAFLW